MKPKRQFIIGVRLTIFAEDGKPSDVDTLRERFLIVEEGSVLSPAKIAGLAYDEAVETLDYWRSTVVDANRG